MKSTVFLMLWAFILTLVCAGVCPPVAADIWTSGKVVYTTNARGNLDIAVMGPKSGGRPINVACGVSPLCSFWASACWCLNSVMNEGGCYDV